MIKAFEDEIFPVLVRGEEYMATLKGDDYGLYSTGVGDCVIRLEENH